MSGAQKPSVTVRIQAEFTFSSETPALREFAESLERIGKEVSEPNRLRAVKSLIDFAVRMDDKQRAQRKK